MFVRILLATATLFTNYPLGVQFRIHQMKQRIYNGYPAEIADTKHQVSIRSRSMDWFYFGMGHICGGSLISRNVVLTAAHCLTDKKGRPLKKSQFVVVMGSLSRLVRDDNTLVYNMKNIRIHRDFNRIEVVFDIAYVVLDGLVPENHPTVQAIALLDSKVADGTICQVTGWGYTEKGSPSDHLMQVDVAKIDINMCKQGYEGYLKGVGHLCAGYMEGEKDSCYGDSGGPLVCDGKLSGIVSFGSGCALKNKPGIYTDVWFFNDWIERLNLEGHLALLTEELSTVKSTVACNKRCENFCRRFLDETKKLFIFLT